MKEQTISKLNKFGHVGQIIALVVRIIVIIALIGTIVGTIIVGAMPENLAAIHINSTAELEMGSDITRFIGFDNASIPDDFFDDMDAAMEDDLSNAVTFDIDELGMSFAYDRVEERDGSPVWFFTAEAPLEITKKTLMRPLILSDITLALVLVCVWFFGIMCKKLRYSRSPFATDFIDSMRNFAITLIPWVVMTSVTSTLSNGVFTNHMDFSFGINIGMLVIVVLMFVLIRIFRYGAILQQESDETI